MEKKIVKVCAWCKKVKSKHGYSALNSYELNKLETHHGIVISHGICPECLAKLRKEGDSNV